MLIYMHFCVLWFLFGCLLCWFFVCLPFKQDLCCCCCCCCCCCITPCFLDLSIKTRFLLCHYATFLRLRRECHIRNSSNKVTICTNSYQNRMKFDLFRTSSKFSLTWVGVHSLQSSGCSQKYQEPECSLIYSVDRSN
jgi:hypothetical protein